MTIANCIRDPASDTDSFSGVHNDVPLSFLRAPANGNGNSDYQALTVKGALEKILAAEPGYYRWGYGNLLNFTPAGAERFERQKRCLRQTGAVSRFGARAQAKAIGTRKVTSTAHRMAALLVGLDTVVHLNYKPVTTACRRAQRPTYMKKGKKKPKIGDIFEICTDRGLAYVQYSHHNSELGYLIRVLDGLFERRPADLRELVRRKTTFFIFYPLPTAVNREGLVWIGHQELPSEAQPFPVFRSGTVNPATGKVGLWWLWDGKKEWPVRELNEEQKTFSIRGIGNHSYLVHKIVTDWTPQKDFA